MKTLPLAVCLLAVSASASETKQSSTVRLHAGAQLGMPVAVGATAVATSFVENRPKFDLDLLWEPSAFLQSYSLGAGWRPFGQFLYLGPRVRLLQFHPPWARGFEADKDNHLGLGLEVGVRARVGTRGQGVVSAALGGTYVPTQAPTLQSMLGLTVGLSWAFWERPL